MCHCVTLKCHCVYLPVNFTVTDSILFVHLCMVCKIEDSFFVVFFSGITALMIYFKTKNKVIKKTNK